MITMIYPENTERYHALLWENLTGFQYWSSILCGKHVKVLIHMYNIFYSYVCVSKLFPAFMI